MNLIKGYTDTTDSKYQFIAWTDIYDLFMIASLKNGSDVRLTVKGSYSDLNRIYELNKDLCTYMVLSQIRLLGDGSKDLNAIRYKTSGHTVPDDFNGFKL